MCAGLATRQIRANVPVSGGRPMPTRNSQSVARAATRRLGRRKLGADRRPMHTAARTVRVARDATFSPTGKTSVMRPTTFASSRTAEITRDGCSSSSGTARRMRRTCFPSSRTAPAVWRTCFPSSRTVLAVWRTCFPSSRTSRAWQLGGLASSGSLDVPQGTSHASSCTSRGIPRFACPSSCGFRPGHLGVVYTRNAEQPGDSVTRFQGSSLFSGPHLRWSASISRQHAPNDLAAPRGSPCIH